MMCPRCGSNEFWVTFACEGVGRFERREEEDVLIVGKVEDDRLLEIECLKCGAKVSVKGVAWDWKEEE